MGMKRNRKNIERRKRGILLGVCFAVILILIILFVRSCGSHEPDRRAKQQLPADAYAETVHLSASGDNLISDRILEQASANAGAEDAYDFSSLYRHLESYLAEHEINWVDVETCINEEITPSGYPYFSTPGQDGLDLVAAGFNVFSLANNHTYDFETQGMEAEMDFFSSKLPQALTVGLWKTEDYGDGTGTLSALTDAYADQNLDAQPDVYYDDIPIFETEGGHKIAFLTYTDMTNATTYNSFHQTPAGSPYRVIYLYETDLIKLQIEKAKELADAVIVSCHWGDEGSHVSNASQQEMAQQIADWGADLIIGAHPHVLQDAAYISTKDGREVFCAYSIGNLVSTQQSPDQIIGAILDATLVFDGNGVTVEDPKLVPIVTHYGENGADATVYLLSDYTDELAKENGISTYMLQSDISEEFNLDYIRKQLKETIDPSFLELENE